MRPAAGFGLAIVLLATAVAVGAPPAKRVDHDPPTARQKAAHLTRARCSTCHAMDRVFHRVAGRTEWFEVVERMRRMPQSGISPVESKIIVDYLVGLNGKTPPAAAKQPAAEAGTGTTIGGRRVWGRAWLSILETASARDGAVRIAGRKYRTSGLEADGRTINLRRGGKTKTVSLNTDGTPGKTALVRSWRLGERTWEVHLILYEIRNGTPRVGRALRRLG